MTAGTKQPESGMNRPPYVGVNRPPSIGANPRWGFGLSSESLFLFLQTECRKIVFFTPSLYELCKQNNSFYTLLSELYERLANMENFFGLMITFTGTTTSEFKKNQVTFLLLISGNWQPSLSETAPMNWGQFNWATIS